MGVRMRWVAVMFMVIRTRRILDLDILDAGGLSGEESGEYDEKESGLIDAGVCCDFMYTNNYFQAPTPSF